MSVTVIVVKTERAEFEDGYNQPEITAFLRRLVDASVKRETGRQLCSIDPIVQSIESFD